MKARKMTKEEANYEMWVNSVEYDILVNGRNYG